MTYSLTWLTWQGWYQRYIKKLWTNVSWIFSPKVNPNFFMGGMVRTSMLGMVITGNASAEINQCPLAKTSHCRRLVHQWMSGVQCRIGHRQRFNGNGSIAQTFHPGNNPNSSCWVFARAGLNALIPWPAFRVVSIDWSVDIGCPCLIRTQRPIHQSSQANWDPKWDGFTPIPLIQPSNEWAVAGDHTALAFLMK